MKEYIASRSKYHAIELQKVKIAQSWPELNQFKQIIKMYNNINYDALGRANVSNQQQAQY